MNMLPVDLVSLSGDQPMTDSLRVARHFSKEHRHVLRAVDGLDCSREFRLRNFGQTIAHRPNPKGGKPISSRVITMTKDGFMFLAMSFTGPEAARVKEAYIEAFNSMADQLERRDLSVLKRLLHHEMRDMDSRRRGQFHGQGLARRRVEKKSLGREEVELRQVAQPMLFELVRGNRGDG